MANPSFNLALTNLLIGLLRNHPHLRPASEQFNALGYQVFGIERAIFCSGAGKKVKPEAIIFSTICDHTLVTEWTEMHAGDERKFQQIARYTRLSRQDLIDRAGIPNPGGNQNSLWLVVLPIYTQDYHQRVVSRMQGVILSSFDLENGNILYHSGESADTKLNAIIQNGIRARRIPMGYVPISFENHKSREFVEAMLLEVVANIVKRKFEFSAEDICSSIFHETWQDFDNDTKKDIKRSAKSIIDKLESKWQGKNWLIRTSDEPRKWSIQITSYPDQTKALNAIKKRIQSYLEKEFESNSQLELDF